MPSQLNLSMQDMARLALGGPKVTNVNIAVLHSLLDLILKKLNCQNEVVSIGGYESKCLENLLVHSKISPISFNDEKMELISEKLDKLADLETRLSEVDAKVEHHFEAIRQCHGIVDDNSNPFDWAKWDVYANVCEDLCTLCEPENEIACSLLRNVDFMRKLLRRVSKPVVDRMFEFEDKIEALHKEFLAFLARAEEEYKKIELIEKCIFEIEMVRKKIGELHALFVSTMEEVQDMLDAKLDKIHMPALKKFIRERFEKMEAEIKRLQMVKDCPKAAGVVMGHVSCLSCGMNKVCTEVGVQPIGVLPDAHPGTYTTSDCEQRKAAKKHCGCGRFAETSEPTLMERIANLSPPPVERLQSTRTNQKVCKLGETRKTMELLVGFDGKLYRAEQNEA